ncbi:hypothetical protein MHF_1140 [Mycoplasma haemofelis Ohio2]|uniref:Uncharacterized protein n=1 Tax=Mycoplasma haemofelis (strain Ohio2) TaxID=859194 RepID=F6FJM8_MYCHI|nr:hypothetical protein MHF_1140 [Mycoplasma haemofelis Ohio2]
MPSTLLKFVGLGSIAAAGGGITLGAMKFSGTEKPTPKSVEAPSESEEVVPPIPTEPTCVIYEAKEPVKKDGVDEFTELLKKFENKEEFFKELQVRRSTNESGLKAELDDACKNLNNKRSVNGNIYLWYGRSGSQETWIYATRMHDKNVDWVNKEGIIKSFETRNTQDR